MAAVERGQKVGFHLQVEAVSRGFRTALAQCDGELGVIEHLDDRGSQCLRVVGGNQEAGGAVVDQGVQTRHSRGDAGNRSGQRQRERASGAGDQGRLAVKVEHGPDTGPSGREIDDADAVGDPE